MWLLGLVVLAADKKCKSGLLEEPEGLVSGFFDGGSGVWPACFGLLILCAGFFGLVCHIDLDNCDWLYYSVEGGLGSYLLKRTFTLS